MKIKRSTFIISAVIASALIGPSFLVGCANKSDSSTMNKTKKTSTPAKAEPTAAPAQEDPMDKVSLWETYKDYFQIGVAAEPARLKDYDSHSALVIRNFNSLTAENAMKPGSIEVQEGSFYFDKADELVDFAIAHNMKMRGHNLLWHQQMPQWFFNDPKDAAKLASREVMLGRLKTYITTVLKHFKDKYGDKNPIYAWDVVNEPLSDSKGLRDLTGGSKWLATVGPDYIEKALEYAHEADPSVKLYINDYNIERDGQKTQAMYDLVKSMLDKKVPIDGIGLQMHVNIYSSVDSIKKSIEKLSQLGVNLQITEMDMDMMGKTSDSDLEKQAELYKNIFEVFKENKQYISSVTFWGISDDLTWLKKPNAPLLFDSNQKAKPAFRALIEASK